MNDSCRLTRLRLYNFRNYTEQVIDLDSGLNVVTGRNAQGKTNLLEAIALLSLTRSPRTSSAAELMRWGEVETAVQGMADRPVGPADLELRLRRDTPSSRVARTTTVDGKPRRARDVLGTCPVVIFSPDDLQLVKGGPEGRRRRLDMLLSQLEPRTAVDLLRYRRIVEQRNTLLRQLRAGVGEVRTLEGFSAELALYGARIRVARTNLVTTLSGTASAALAELSGGETLSLRHVSGAPETASVEAAEAQLLEQAERLRGEELARGQTLIGPHRDDMEIELDGHPARTTASQGQQRTVVLALALAEVRHVRRVAGMAPILLLDDVLSELDGERRQQLLTTVATTEGLQVLVTTSEPELAGKLAAPHSVTFVVSAGSVAPVAPVAYAT